MPHTRATHDRAALAVNRDGLDKVMEANGVPSVAALAVRIGVDRSTAHRVLGGHTAPGEEFIARALAAFPGTKFEDLFEVRAQA